MCKEMPVIPVNRVVDPKRIMGKMEGRGGGEAQGVAEKRYNKKPVKQASEWRHGGTWSAVEPEEELSVVVGREDGVVLVVEAEVLAVRGHLQDLLPDLDAERLKETVSAIKGTI
jgi:hypothetical protein